MKLLLLANDLVGCDYIEPYAGGVSVALSLLYEEYAARIHINDIDRSVIAFWRAVLDHTEELCARIADTPVTVDEWYRRRALQLA
jgi:DNA adenine methylase